MLVHKLIAFLMIGTLAFDVTAQGAIGLPENDACPFLCKLFRSTTKVLEPTRKTPGDTSKANEPTPKAPEPASKIPEPVLLDSNLFKASVPFENGDAEPMKSKLTDPTSDFLYEAKLVPFSGEGKRTSSDSMVDASVLAKLAEGFTTLSGKEVDRKEKLCTWNGMVNAFAQHLIDDHFRLKEGNRILQAIKVSIYWPSGRSIFHNDNKNFLVWCNEEDHLSIISMQLGGDLDGVYLRLTTEINDIEKRILFSHDDRLGFLTFCPTNLGTTVRASLKIKVPKLVANLAKLEEVARLHQ